MTRNRRTDRSHTEPAAGGEAHTPSSFDRVMLWILLALIPLRAIINESVTFEVARLFRHVQALGTANPGTTFLFALAIVVVAGVALCRRLAKGEPRYRWTGGEIGLALLVVAGGVSVWIAGQKHLALVGAVNFITLILYGLTLRQFLTSPWRVRLALVVIVGTAAMVLAKGAYQYFVEQPDTIAYWEEHKTELLGDEANAKSGKAAGLEHDYEMRMLSRLITAYYPHANVLGSHLILFIMAGASLIGDRLARIRKKLISALTLLVPGIVIGGCFVELVGTGSKGAFACGVLAVVLWIAGSLAARFIARHRRLTAIGVWGCGVAGTIGLAVFLHFNEAGLGKSIQFRSMYWRGATAMIEDGHWLGVGPNNFGRHFLKYKPVECPEEVESPHSWIVQLASEWGLPGLIAFLIVLGGVTWRLTRPSATAADVSSRDPPGSIVWWPIAVGGGALAYWLVQHAADPFDVLALSLFIAAVPWMVVALLAGFEAANESTYSDAALVGVLPGVVAGILCFLLHTGIDLAMFEGGPATSFFAMVAITLAAFDLRAADEADAVIVPTAPRARQPRKPAATIVGVATALLGIVAFVQFVVKPFACHNALQQARADTEPTPWQTYLSVGGGASYRDAIDAYTLDGTAASELVEQLIPRVRSVANADEAMGFVETFARRDPYDGLRYNLRGTIESQKYQMTKDIRHLRAAARAYQKYVDDYPTSPLRHIYAANLYTILARDGNDEAARDAAVEHLGTALSLDEKRIYVSKPNRLPEEQIEQIREAIRQLQGMKFAATSGPATESP